MNESERELMDKKQKNKKLKGISVKEALKLISVKKESRILELITEAAKVRNAYHGNRVSLCSVINAKSGNCTQDCAFCAQSVHSKAKIQKYSLLSKDEMLSAVRSISEKTNGRIGIVTSGKAIGSKKDQKTICDTVNNMMADYSVSPCASLGIVSKEFLKDLKKTGLTRYHHNLETAESFFPEICTTRDYSSQIEAVKNAREAGLSVCSGGIFGLGESDEQRIELFETLRQLDVDSIPLNFLNPVKGIRLKKIKPLSPFECLKIIAVARLMLPSKEIRVCGGREYNLRDFQSWIFAAGANGMMVGGYLTTCGRDVATDLQMIADAGMEVV